jgi:hypothetical protein
VWTGSSASLVILRQNDRPSEEETLQPLTTFHSSFISSLVDGSMIVSSWTPLGKRPAAAPIARGLWRPAALLPLTTLGEYCLLLMTVLGMCAGLVWVGKYGWCSSGISG